MGTNDINKDAWNQHAKRYQSRAGFSFDNVDYGIMNGLTDGDLGCGLLYRWNPSGYFQNRTPRRVKQKEKYHVFR